MSETEIKTGHVTGFFISAQLCAARRSCDQPAGGTNLSVRSLVSILRRMQHIAVELGVGEAAGGQTSTARHQHLLSKVRQKVSDRQAQNGSITTFHSV